MNLILILFYKNMIKPMKKYGKLKLIETFKKKITTTQTYGKFECECGKIIEMRMASVKNGHSKSCGCMSKNASIRHARKPINFFDQNDESTYYWAGFLFGDGCVNKQGGLTICLSNANGGYEHLKKLSKFIYGQNYVREYINNCHLSVYNSVVLKNLSSFNILPNKTHNCIFKVPDDTCVQHFIRGYFDADGWASYKICKNNMRKYKYLTIGLCSYLSENMIMVSNYLPTKTYINKKKKQELYELRIQSQKDVRKFIEFILPINKELCLKYKWSKLWNFVNS